jgi:lipoprotein-anchoring transpeptidase ErfK/SrfK
MNHKFIEAREYVIKAREALRRGDRESARQLGEQAALRAPEMEDAWLVLAASDPNPEDTLAYAHKALELKPESLRARRAVDWARSRLGGGQASSDAVMGLRTTHPYQTAVPVPALKSNRINWLYPVLLVGGGCLLVGLIAVAILIGPTMLSVAREITAPQPEEILWAPVQIARPGLGPVDAHPFAPAPEEALTIVPTEPEPTRTPRPTQVPTSTPTLAPTETPAASPTPEATETPGVIVMEILADTPTSESVPPEPSDPDPVLASSGVRWIDVDLSDQMVYAYEGDTVVNSFVVSTGTWRTPTIKGKFKVYIRLRSGDMRGPGYYLQDVPYIMYFKGDYGLHGTYWHNNFGTPMSHGCVNLSIPDAAWLYDWSAMGTVVNVHD